MNENQLVKKYCGRDQVEVDFKDLKGILDLGKIIYQRPERIDAYIFLKESMGDMLLVEGEISPLGVKTYAVARDTELNKLLRKTFDLPEPLDLIKILNESVVQQIDTCVTQWYENCCADYP